MDTRSRPEVDYQSRCPDERELRLYLDGLAGSHASAIACHIDTCDLCCTRLTRLIDTSYTDLPLQLLNAGKTDLPADDLLPLPRPHLSLPDSALVTVSRITFPGPIDADAPLGTFQTYHVRRELGQGGYGIVYEAYDTSRHRLVALKFLSPELATDPVHCHSFNKEARTAATINGKYTVNVHTTGIYDTSPPTPFLVMDYVNGPALSTLLQNHSALYHDWNNTVPVIRDVAKGLSEVHQADVVHRDIKPSNILFDSNVTRFKIADFGVARFIPHEHGTTITAAVVGTSRYMSPEHRFTNNKIDKRSDIFSLGVVAYEMLTGHFPPENICRKPRHFPRQLNATIPLALERIILQCLEEDPCDRYQSADELIGDLDRLERGESISAARRTWFHRGLRNLLRRPLVACLVGVFICTSATAVLIAMRSSSNAETAEKRMRESDRAADLAEVRQIRNSRSPGQAIRSLEVIKRSAASASGPSPELVDQAIAALALTDLRPTRQLQHDPTFGFAVDGRFSMYAVARGDGTVAVHNLTTGSLITDFTVPLDSICRLKFSNDGRFLASLSMHKDSREIGNGGFCVWHVPSGSAVSLVPPSISGESFEFVTDGSKLVLINDKGDLTTFGLTPPTKLSSVPFGLGAQSLAVSRDGQLIAISFESRNEVKILHRETGELKQSLSHPQPVGGVAWHDDNATLAVASGTDIYLWDVSDIGELTEPFATWKVHESRVAQLAFAQDRILASADWHGTVRLWDVASRSQLITAQVGPWINFSEDGRQLAGAWDERTVGIWEVMTSPVTHTFGLRRKDVGGVHVAFSPESSLLASGSIDGIRLWDPLGGVSPVATVTSESAGAIRFHPLRNVLIATHRAGLSSWSIAHSDKSDSVSISEPRYLLATPTAYFGHLLATSRKGERLALTRSRAGTVVVVDAGSQQRFTVTDSDGIESLAMAPDGRFLAIGTWSNDARTIILDADSRKTIKQLPTGRASLFFDPSGSWLVTASRDSYSFWDTDTWNNQDRIPRAGSDHGPLAFSPNGTVIALTTGPDHVQLFDLETRALLATLESPQMRAIVSMTFSPHGQFLAVGCWDTSIIIWDLSRLSEELTNLRLPFPDVALDHRTYKPHDLSDIDWAPIFRSSPKEVTAWNWAGAMACYEANKWDDAIWYLDRIIATSPNDWVALIHRGSANANLKRWQDAMADYVAAINTESQKARARAWHSLGVLSLVLGNSDKYRETCIDVQRRFLDTTDATDATQTVRTCILAPDAVRDYGPLVALQQSVVEREPNTYWYHNTFGAVLYRAGEFTYALDWLSKSVTMPNNNASDHFFLSMVHSALGNHDQAQRFFHSGDEWMSQKELARPPYWGDWLEYELLRQEAKSVLTSATNQK